MDLAKRLLERLDARVPDRLSPISGTWSRLIRIVWLLAFLLAIVNPVLGLWSRYAAPTANSALVLGSSVGVGLEPDDATRIRFTIGPYARDAGIQAGDAIVAIDGVPLPRSMSVMEQELESNASDPAYLRMVDLLFSSKPEQTTLTIASPNGSKREIAIQTGEHHIDAAARQMGLSPKLLSFIDVLHVLAYPVLLWVAFVLYGRNAARPLPVLLSFSILVSVAVDQPAGTFIADLGLPRPLHVAIYDVANILLLAAILLFPDARLKPRSILLALGLLPVLFFLQGVIYQAVFVLALVVGTTVFIKRLRTETGIQRQQLKLLFFGFALYPAFRSISIASDFAKWKSSSLSGQLLFELAAASTLALAVASLFVVLFSALRSHRLYDADALFTRSAMVAAITLTITGFFAITSAFLETTAESLFGQGAGPWPSLIAATAAVLLIKPAQRRIHDWSERRFQRGLFELRTELPKRMEDLRETASPAALFQEALSHIVTALRTTRAAAVVDGKVSATIGISASEVRNWLAAEQPSPANGVQCDRSDALLPVRLALNLGTGSSSPGHILLGPRPDGSIYSRDERDVLLEIAEPIARAIDVARQRHQAAEEDRRWKLRQEKRVRQLEKQLMAYFSGRDTKATQS
jgi:hypothetical protein